ncbi:M4 family metallopeptidase [Geobacillus thermocatenulatus]|uniref:M4 family metallopeptidase n=1 Tax=Geobacillus thermocatenulatus TaxID=33938 RepID=UPI0004736717|nr:M4 family metallopeptidase [Geobacillus thermocatenulatus]
MNKRAMLGAIGLAVGLMAWPLGASAKEKSIVWNEQWKMPSFVSGSLLKGEEAPEQLVYRYLDQEKNTFQLGGQARERLSLIGKQVDELGHTVMRFEQRYHGIPVYGAVLVAHVNDGELSSLSGALIPNLDKQTLKTKAAISVQQAERIAKQDVVDAVTNEWPAFEVGKSTRLVIYPDGEDARLAYEVNVRFLTPVPGNWIYMVDATDGRVLDKWNQMDEAKPDGGQPVAGTSTVGVGRGVLGDQKYINTTYSSYDGYYYLQDNTRGSGIFTYDGRNRTTLPGSLWADSDNQFFASYDTAAVDAHYYAGVVYDYYKNVHGRLSYDGSNAAIRSTVHYGRGYNNAFWNGSQMVYGDGDGQTFLPFSGGIDVVAHELTHAVTDYTAGLVYQNESGAINEAMSDIFGTLVEFYANRNPDWEIGEDIYTPGIAGDALRSMSDPAKYGDPDHYSKRYTGTQDNGGVHTNSGIINKAAYLLSQGGVHYGVSVTGIGRDKMGKIFYRALVYYLTPTSNFSQLRAACVQAAADLYGSTSQEVNSVKQAFNAVGVY